MIDRFKSYQHLSLMVSALGFAAFAISITFPFVALDDAKHIWQNPYVMSLSSGNLLYFWNQPYYGLYIPMVYNSWSLLSSATQALGLSNPTTAIQAPLYHASNCLLHAINCYLVFHLFSTIWTANRQSKHNEATAPEAGRLRAFVIAAMFAIHPLHAEAVAWASGLKDVLSGFFALLSLVLLVENYAAPGPEKSKAAKSKIRSDENPRGPLTLKFKNRKLTTLMSYVFYTLALLSKPSVVILPVCAALILNLLGHIPWRRGLSLSLPYLIIAAPIVWWTKAAQPDARLEFHLELWQRPLIALYSLGFYLFKFVVPLGLAPDYGLSPDLAWASAGFWPLCLLGAAVVGVGLWALKVGSPLIACGAGLFVIGLLPVLGLIPFEFQNMSTVADRYVYLFPLLGCGLMVASFLERIPQKLKFALCLTAVIVLFTLTLLQTRQWRSNEALFAHTIEVNPQSYLSYNNLGLQEVRNGHFAPAESLLLKALALKPNYMASLANLGVVYFKQQDFAKAIEHYNHALSLFPDAGPGSPATLGDMHFNLGASYVNVGKNDLAIQHLRKAVEINPDHYTAHFNLGRLMAALGRREEALKSFGQALRLKPHDTATIEELKKIGVVVR